MIQSYNRQYSDDFYLLHEHPGGHASSREHHDEELGKRTNIHKMQSESNEHVRKTKSFFTKSWRIKIALESYFAGHAQEIGERNWMYLEMQTTLFNTYSPKLNAVILKALCEQLEENNQLDAGTVPEIYLQHGQILKGGEFWDDVNNGDLHNLCWRHGVKKLNGCTLKVSTKMSQNKNASIRARNCWI